MSTSPDRSGGARRRSLRGRTAAVALLTAIIGLLGPVLATAPIAHADAYRYWGYHQWENGQWVFAQTGPDTVVPADGAVEGWRFAITDEAGNKFPRAAGDFDQICGSTASETGKKRVAIVIDYGTSADAPAGGQPPAARGACAVVDADANGAQVLTAAATARVEGGLTCGIDGYPATGCGEPVASAPPAGSEDQVELSLPAPATPPGGATGDEAVDNAAAEADESDGIPVGLLLGIAVVAVLGVAAALTARRSRAS